VVFSLLRQAIAGVCSRGEKYVGSDICAREIFCPATLRWNDVSNSAADTDGDGLTNQQEYAFGLNPTLGSSVNPITVPLDKTTGTFTYTRRATPAASGLTYTVFTSSDLDT
jgi:hypothetical protein